MIYFRNSVKFHRSWISDKEFFSDCPIEGEVWIDFDTYKGKKLSNIYQISNKGRLRRLNGPIITGTLTHDGYHTVSMVAADSGGRSMSTGAHQIVLRMFVGDPPKGMIDPTVQHINHDKLDNRVENLCWMSAFDNNQERHGRRAKIIDSDGEHVFGSQKQASHYIGRYEDYISECINHGHRITNANGQNVEVYTEIDGQWIKYERPVPTNRSFCKLIRNGACKEFESLQACSRYLGKDASYVSNMLFNSWPILPNEDHEFFRYDHDLREYVKYLPTSERVMHHARKCNIVIEGIEHEFPSISKAAEFIGRDSEYLRIAIKEGKVVRDKLGRIVYASAER